MTDKNKHTNPRPPIVVVAGHIDHGKSRLLDYIRNTNIVKGEAGGITQHIGAYEAEVKCDLSSHEHKTKKITFLDTPGHEAFSQMRVRGVKIADIAILVIAADEGPKPQTIESYKAIKETGMPFVIALNKIDKPNAEIEKVKGQLAENQIFVEGYGGQIPIVNISAETGEGINELLDMILLLTEMENLTANPNENASGFVVESHLDSKRGISATLIIQNGLIKKGMFVVAENTIAPVKIFEDFQGKTLEEATFSSPIKIVGFNAMPQAGADFKTFNSKKEAEEAIKLTKNNTKQQTPETNSSTEEKKEIIIPLIIKTDVSGSLEALEKEIFKIKHDNVQINILRKGVGNINEDDLKLSSSAENPIIVGFNVKSDSVAKDLAERFKTEIFLSDIIYKISEQVEDEIKKREEIADEGKDKIIGTINILKTFSRTKNKQVIGGEVVSGKIIERKRFKIKRNDAEVGEGKITGLQQNKAPTKEIEQGEFGAMTENKLEIAKGDELLIIN